MTNIIILNEVVSVLNYDMLVIYSGTLYNSGLEKFYFGYGYLGLLGFKILINTLYVSFVMCKGSRLQYFRSKN